MKNKLLITTALVALSVSGNAYAENLPEDAVKDNQDKIQKVTDKYVGIIDSLVVEKEKEVMTV